MANRDTTGRYYAYHPSVGRVRINNTTDNDDNVAAVEWAKTHKFDNVTYVTGPIARPTNVVKLWDRNERGDSNRLDVAVLLQRTFPGWAPTTYFAIAIEIERIYTESRAETL